MSKLRVPAAYLPVFCQELSQLVRAGLPIAEGLAMLREDETERGMRAFLEELCKYADEGMPLSEALRRTGAFPAYMTDMIDLAERTGRLQDVLPALAAYYDRQQRMKSDIRHAVAVPLALFVVMIAVVLLLMTQVLPVFDRVFAQLGVAMSPLAVSMMHIGSVLSGAWIGIAAVAGVLAVCGVCIACIPGLRTRVSAAARSRFGGRGLFALLASARFASAMAMGTASGLAMDEAVALAAGLCGGARRIDEKTAHCREAIDAGGSAAAALAESGLFSVRDSRLLMLAERTGSLSETLNQLASRMEEESVRRIDARISAIEPAIVILTAALAGVILLSVMLPLMGVMSTIG